LSGRLAPKLEPDIVTIDAMGCQKEIAAKIIGKGADYLLAPYRQPGALRDDVELFVTEQIERGFADAALSRHQTVKRSWTHRNARLYFLARSRCRPSRMTPSATTGLSKPSLGDGYGIS
jgi:hypothetical protein